MDVLVRLINGIEKISIFEIIGGFFGDECFIFGYDDGKNSWRVIEWCVVVFIKGFVIGGGF